MFQNFFCDPLYFQASKVTTIAYECFKELLIRFNVLRKNLKNDSDDMTVLSNSLDGTMTLWQIAFDAPYSQIRKDAIDLLIEINYSIWKRRRISLASITQSFALTATELVNKDLCTSRIEDYLAAILGFAQKFEKLGYSKISKDAYEKSPYTTRSCTFKNRTLSVKLQNDMTLGDLRAALSYRLKLHKDCLLISTKELRLGPEYESCGVSEFGTVWSYRRLRLCCGDCEAGGGW